MSDTEPIVPLRSRRSRRSGAGAEANHARPADIAPCVSFDRRELNTILSLYGYMVAQGEWRDYAISFGNEKAEFCVFRRSSEMPLYRIVKQPKLARKTGAYSVVAQGGHIMRRGQDLEQVLRVLRKQPKLVAVV